MEEQEKFKHLVYTIYPQKTVNRKKILVGVSLALLIFFTGFAVLRKNKQSKTTVIRQPQQNHVQETPVSETERIATLDWNIARWQLYGFLYPNDFSLISGDLEQDYFLLAWYKNADSRNFIQISGYLESVTFYVDELIQKKIKGIKVNSITKYEIRKATDGEFILRYVWQKNNKASASFRSHEIIKKLDEKYYTFVVTAPLAIWGENRELIEEIIKNVTY